MNLKQLIKNNSNIISNIIGTILVRGGSFLIAIVSMPMYLNYFNNNAVLGIWFTILAVLSWMLSFDLGIGNGLRNNLVESISKNDTESTKKYISSAYILLGVITIGLIVISFFLFPFLNWNKILNITTIQIDQKSLLLVIRIIFIGILLQFFLRLINSILFALQKSAITNLLTLISVGLQVGYLFIGKTGNLMTDLINLAWVQVITVNIPLLITTIIIFSKNLRKSLPSIKFYNTKVAVNVLKLGGSFFILQIMYMIIYTTNEYFLTYFFGSSCVVDYQIYMKLFSIFGSLFAIALIPIWSAVTKAFVEKNIEWIIKLNKFLYFFGLVAALFQLALIPFLQPILNIWLHEKTITVNYFYAVVFALYSSVYIWISINSTIANGLSELKTQKITYSFAVIFKIVMIIVLSSFFKNWIMVLVISIISLIPYCIWQPIKIRKLLSARLSQNNDCNEFEKYC